MESRPTREEGEFDRCSGLDGHQGTRSPSIFCFWSRAEVIDQADEQSNATRQQQPEGLLVRSRLAPRSVRKSGSKDRNTTQVGNDIPMLFELPVCLSTMPSSSAACRSIGVQQSAKMKLRMNHTTK